MLLKQNRSIRLPEDDVDALKHAGVFTIRKILLIYIYIYIYIYICCAFVGLDSKQFPIICLDYQVQYPSYLAVKLILLLYEHHYSTTDFTHAIQIATKAHVYFPVWALF